MTQQEAEKWLQDKDSLEPDEKLTDIGLTVGNESDDE